MHLNEQIKYNDKKFVYAILTKEECTHPFPQAKISQKLSFKITENDGSYDEDYDLEDLQITVKDYVTGFPLQNGQFKSAWDTIGADAKAAEAMSTFQLPFKSMDMAVAGVIKILGMSVCEGTERVNVTEKVHNLLVSGMFMGAEMVLVRAQLGFNQEYGCVLKLTVRSTNEIVSNTLLEAII